MICDELWKKSRFLLLAKGEMERVLSVDCFGSFSTGELMPLNKHY